MINGVEVVNTKQDMKRESADFQIIKSRIRRSSCVELMQCCLLASLKETQRDSAVPAKLNPFLSILLSDFQQIFQPLRPPLSSCIQRHLLHIKQRSKGLILSQLFFLVVLCLLARLPPTFLISADQKRIRWDHLSAEGTAREVLIDHLVVCTLSHSGARITPTHSSTHSAHLAANNAPRSRHSSPSCLNTRGG